MHRLLASIVGSSPRVRGTPIVVFPTPLLPRFIPACTGNALLLRNWHNLTSVHPRVYGERIGDVSQNVEADGSSPRVRGTRNVSGTALERFRFIPACTGNASLQSTHRVEWPVHPRVYGERARQVRPQFGVIGSSPRVRGTLGCGVRSIEAARFIPACTGNASTWHQSGRREPVHPRVYGERVAGKVAHGPASGSSPRVRGTLAAGTITVTGARFIPACTGNAPLNVTMAAVGTVHPRVYGERFPSTTPMDGSIGSSPRVRGTHPLADNLI